MDSPINILYFANQDNYCKQFHKYLQKKGVGCNLLVTKTMFDLLQQDSFLDKCKVIICELFYNRILLEDASDIFNKIAEHAFVIGLTKSEDIAIEQFGSAAALRLIDTLEIKSGWEQIWNRIVELLNFIEKPALTLRLDEIPVCDLLEMAHNCKWTSLITIYDWSLSLTSKNIRGNIYFNQGTPDMAWSTDNTGIDAVRDFLTLKEGTAQVYHTSQGYFVKNLEESIQEILLNYYTDYDRNIVK